MASESWKEFLRPYYLKWLYFRLPSNRPDYLSACWNSPHFAVTNELAERVPPTAGQPDVLLLPMTDWHSRIQRSQHLAMNFGDLGARCFYLNPHLGREFPHVFHPEDALRVGLPTPRTIELHIHLPREPVFHHRLLNEDETRRVVSGIRRVLDASRAARPILFVSFPLWAETAMRLKREIGAPIVYDCHDLLSGFRDISPEILAAESNLLANADLVAFSSQWLFDEMTRGMPDLKSRSMMARNGVTPSAIPALPRPFRAGPPLIGYAGSLDFWFDVESIRLAAQLHPDWRFVLLGRVEAEPIRALERLPNVQLVGEVSFAALQSRMPEFDVAIIPFLKMPLTLATNPIKLYEYFSFGIPVVATRLPEIEMLGDLVYVSDTPEGFVRQLERAVEEDSPDLRARRVEAAGQNTWHARAEQLLSHFRTL